MVWSLNAATARDFQVDQKRLEELIHWSTDIDNFSNPKNREQAEQSEEKTAAANIDTMAQLLLALNRVDASSSADWKRKFADYLVKTQQDDGTWRACGQLPFQKRPKDETTSVTTSWTSYALREYDNEIPLNIPLPINLQWTEDDKSSKSTEHWAVRLLIAYQTGETEKVAKLSQQLLKFQRVDGGWGWLTDGESDALGTGIALYSLLKSGLSRESDEVRNAVKFLASTQSDDGSWQVRSTKGKHQQKFTPTAIYWGTTWAFIALCETLPKVE